MNSLRIYCYLLLLAVELFLCPVAVNCRNSQKYLKDNNNNTKVRFLKAIKRKFSNLRNDIKDIRKELEQINRTSDNNFCELRQRSSLQPMINTKSSAMNKQRGIASKIGHEKKYVCNVMTQIMKDVMNLESVFTESRRALNQSDYDMKAQINEMAPKVNKHDNIINSLNNSFIELDNQLKENNIATVNYKEELDKLKEQLGELEEKLMDEERNSKSLNKRDVNMKEKLDKISPKVKNHDKVLNSLNNSFTNLDNQLKEYTSASRKNKGDLDKVKEQLEDVEGKLSGLERNSNKLNQRDTDLREQLDKMYSKVKKHDNVLNSLNNSFSKLDKRLDEYNIATKNNKGDLDKLKEQLREVDGSIQTLLKNICTLKECPPGWSKHCPSCYAFNSESLNWNNAAKKCKKDGAYLVEYDGKEEVDYVLNLVWGIKKNWGTYKFNGFWAGASDSKEEGTWIWSKSGRRLKSGFTFWYKGQPDNYRKEEDCLTSTFNENGRWNDWPCSISRTFVCEKSLFSEI